MQACTLIKCEAGKLEEAVENIKKIENVKKVFSCSGQFDIAVLLEAENLKALGETAVKIHSIKEVKASETLMEVPTI
ncbi:MAG: Lrp/AsnC ligand binding domain-containing protein [Candidatus Wukongarchaeota archaeon]|nr:Lrp/AsnC ligand binding domain-containing protein [Candidatus Wukongarchaeota archaeon]MDO8130048.1 Lrp/AsnC ligand binding domain-containing protein [Candidatus Wukongarchaeota archaeon]